MEIGQSNSKTIREVISGIKIVESEYRVMKPIFEDVKIDRPVFVDRPIEVPSGWDKVINELVLEISKGIVDQCTILINQKLDGAIAQRIKDIQVPTITYKETVKEIAVERPVYTDVQVDRVTYKDKEITNPVFKDVIVINAILKDVEVERPVYKEKVVIQPRFEEVIIHKPTIVKKEITVIHPKYIDMKGNPEPDESS